MSDQLKKLQNRSGGQCELCKSLEALVIYEIPSSPNDVNETSILICSNCTQQITDDDQIDPNYWRCLNDAIWSDVPAVQVVSYRMLHKLKDEGWPVELLEMIYLDDETKAWADAGISHGPKMIHVDANGHVLQKGDHVVLIKDLDVKGANFTAKRGTAVRNITLDPDNENHIEGKVNGQQIVILTQYVKKS